MTSCIKKPRMVHVIQVKGFFWRETAHAGAPYYSLITITMSEFVKEYHLLNSTKLAVSICC